MFRRPLVDDDDLPSHAGPEESIVLSVVGEKSADSALRGGLLESSVIAQTGNGELAGLDKIHSYVGSESPPPLLGGAMKHDDVELEVGSKVVAQVSAAGRFKEALGLGNFRFRDGRRPSQFRLPELRIGRQFGPLQFG